MFGDSAQNCETSAKIIVYCARQYISSSIEKSFLMYKEKCVAGVNIVTSDILKYSEKIVKTTKKKSILRQILGIC
jgi:hypothetical protein